LDSMINANILVGGRLRLSCGTSRKVYVLLAANTLPSRSSRFPYVSQLSGVSAGFLRIFPRARAERAEGHGNARFIGSIFAVQAAVLCGCRTAENRGLNRISVKGVLSSRHSFDEVSRINFRFRLLVSWSSPHGRAASSHKLWCR